MKKTEEELSWFDLPHVVANGKFYAIHDDMAIPSEIEGIDSLNGSFIVERRSLPIKECTLIARKITDMTIQELKECPLLIDFYYELYIDPDEVSDADKKDYLLNRLFNLIHFFDVRLYISSLGVYPFNQSHLKPATTEYMNGEVQVKPSIVIDIKTIKNYKTRQDDLYGE